MEKHLVNGIELAAVDTGSGLPLVLIHGFPLDHCMWSEQIEALSGRCRVIAPDLRGFGQSDVTEAAVTMEQFADDVAGLLDALEVDRPVVFCGLSMGGYVAWQFWRRHSARVRGMILCDTRAIADSPEAADGRLKMARRVIEEGPAPLVEAMMPKLSAEPAAGDDSQTIAVLRRMMLGADPKGIAAAARGMAERPDCTDLLPQITCQCLVVVGQLDAISPVGEMRTIAEAIPDAELVEIAGAGHMSPMEKPDEVNRAIGRFLDRLGTS